MTDVKIIYEDADIVALNKPAGLLVHGIYRHLEAKHTEKTLADWLIEKYPEINGVGDPAVGGIERAGIVHRLDRETSGVMVVAKNQKAFEFLKNQFQNRDIRKSYIALVWGRVKEKTGVIDKPISIKSGSVKRTVFKGKMTRTAVTEYETQKYFRYKEEFMTLLIARPRTGRTHQIRVHLNAIGHPVVGDKMYGKKPIPEGLKRHFLHAESLRLVLPNGKSISLNADLAEDLSRFLSSLEEADLD